MLQNSVLLHSSLKIGYVTVLSHFNSLLFHFPLNVWTKKKKQNRTNRTYIQQIYSFSATSLENKFSAMEEWLYK